MIFGKDRTLLRRMSPFMADFVAEVVKKTP